MFWQGTTTQLGVRGTCLHWHKAISENVFANHFCWLPSVEGKMDELSAISDDVGSINSAGLDDALTRVPIEAVCQQVG